MTLTDDDKDAVLRSVDALLGNPDQWIEPSGYRQSLALASIDSVFSLRTRYSSVVSVLNRYRDARRRAGADPDSDGARELLETITAAGGVEAAAQTLFTKNLSPGTRILKVESLVRGVTALQEVGVETAQDLREKAADPEVRRAWLGQLGLGKASWDYLLMNVGVDGSKADTMLIRFVANALSTDERITPGRAQEAVHAAADSLGVSRKILDHTIWHYQSRAAASRAR